MCYLPKLFTAVVQVLPRYIHRTHLSGVHLLPPMMLAEIVQMSQSAVLDRYSREHVVFRTLLDNKISLASKVNKLFLGFCQLYISGTGDRSVLLCANRSFNILPPASGIPRASDAFSCPQSSRAGRRGGEFDR